MLPIPDWSGCRISLRGPSDGSSLYPQVINYNNYSPSYRGHVSTVVFMPKSALSDDSPKRVINVLSMCMFLPVC